MRNQRGFSLIELMIAVLLSLVLMIGVVQVFLASRTVFSNQQGVSRIQETGRLAMEFISRDVRMAGFLGCMDRSSTKTTNTLNSNATFSNRIGVGIEGYESNPVGSGLNPVPVAGTDILVVRTANRSSITLTRNNTPSTVFVTDTGQIANACGGTNPSFSGLCPNDILVVSDCFQQTIFQASTITQGAGEINITHTAAGSVGNATANWPATNVFGPGSEVLNANHTVYYIAVSPVSGQRALFQNINGTSLELLEGAENMQLTYSRLNTPTVYQNAAALPVTVWTDAANPVVSVRVELLVRSIEDNMVSDAERQPYVLEGVTITPTDRRLRQVFVNTIGIRSRLP